MAAEKPTSVRTLHYAQDHNAGITSSFSYSHCFSCLISFACCKTVASRMATFCLKARFSFCSLSTEGLICLTGRPENVMCTTEKFAYLKQSLLYFQILQIVDAFSNEIHRRKTKITNLEICTSQV